MRLVLSVCWSVAVSTRAGHTLLGISVLCACVLVLQRVASCFQIFVQKQRDARNGRSRWSALDEGSGRSVV